MTGREAWASYWQHGAILTLLSMTPRGDSLDSARLRLELIRLAWKDWVWWGIGPGCTKLVHLRAHARDELSDPTGSVHNEFIQMASEFGIAGILASLLFLWRAGNGLHLGDPWSACVVAGLVLACGTMALRVAPIGLIFLLACAEVAR